jgi:hypothetical protein
MKLIDKIYNGAWNNLELSSSAKKSLNTSAGIIGLGLIAAIIIIKRK